MAGQVIQVVGGHLYDHYETCMDGVIALSDGIKNNGALTSLDIRRNNIPRKKQAILKRICNSKSTHVDLKL